MGSQMVPRKVAEGLELRNSFSPAWLRQGKNCVIKWPSKSKYGVHPWAKEDILFLAVMGRYSENMQNAL